MSSVVIAMVASLLTSISRDSDTQTRHIRTNSQERIANTPGTEGPLPLIGDRFHYEDGRRGGGEKRGEGCKATKRDRDSEGMTEKASKGTRVAMWSNYQQGKGVSVIRDWDGSSE